MTAEEKKEARRKYHREYYHKHRKKYNEYWAGYRRRFHESQKRRNIKTPKATAINFSDLQHLDLAHFERACGSILKGSLKLVTLKRKEDRHLQSTVSPDL